ncbi:glycosyltransferase family 4 protein [Salipiger sp. P9]|uniref:glycosyltransferase family 4 protein n=1 Tax=Salipiger pentaromativorans TaxID=2943193 RepID=UPI0021587658|nr:glycosyltransferase family 4 protein [Salipiger pentaromativorans]MCR8549087.1 glycosyltransferase family 4 protein [Salipiger pentaromativorans]
MCDFSPLDRNFYSGGNARIYDALRKHAGNVTILSQSWGLAEPLRRAICRLPDDIALRLRWRAHLALAPLIARHVRAELARGRYDVLFCAYSFHSLYRVAPPAPLVTAFTSDATQTVYRNSEIGQAHPSKYPGGRRLDNWVERCESRVFRNTDVLFWPSQWLKDAADSRYGLDQSASLMVPWGAGIAPPPPPTPSPIARDRSVELLLVGRDWFAKGGPIAFDTMAALRARGLDARLTVIGCVPPEFHRNEWVTVHPQLDKSVPEEAATFARAYETAHFLVQPSYESYGFAFCEASAHGLPALCLRVGGVPVRDGINGHALPPGSEPAAFADMIEGYAGTPEAYAALSRAARREYEEHLNWDAWGRRVADVLHETVARQQR